jgi:hypothetical protein
VRRVSVLFASVAAVVVSSACWADLPCDIIVNTPADLDDIRNNLEGHYCLGRDIDMKGVANFVAIGTLDAPFHGTFNGKGHVIRNLTINDTTLGYAALFGFARAQFCNIGFLNVRITGVGWAGALVAHLNPGTIVNAYATGSVSSPAAGGLAGAVKKGGRAGR